MKKAIFTKIMCLTFVLVLSLALVSCNKGGVIFDTHLKFNKCEARFPDGTVRVLRIKKWYDYQDSDQIQIETTSGAVFVFHANNVVLINDEKLAGAYDGKDD